MISVPVLIVYYSYERYLCGVAKERYEEAVRTLSLTEAQYYLIEDQEACHINVDRAFDAII